jgi:hypothetical protein
MDHEAELVVYLLGTGLIKAGAAIVSLDVTRICDRASGESTMIAVACTVWTPQTLRSWVRIPLDGWDIL